MSGLIFESASKMQSVDGSSYIYIIQAPLEAEIGSMRGFHVLQVGSSSDRNQFTKRMVQYTLASHYAGGDPYAYSVSSPKPDHYTPSDIRLNFKKTHWCNRLPTGKWGRTQANRILLSRTGWSEAAYVIVNLLVDQTLRVRRARWQVNIFENPQLFGNGASSCGEQ